MDFRNGRQSRNIEDRRGQGAPRIGGKGKVGIGTVLVALVAMYFGVDPSVVLQGGSMLAPPAQQGSGPRPAAENAQAKFVSQVLADTEDTWSALFSAAGQRYKEPQLVLFTGATQSACGVGRAETGPFYCPADSKVYLDLSFFDDLHRRFGAPGDFAQAYVIAHEVGHHVQNVLGISGQVQRERQRRSEREANQLSVMLELQADCYAGLWAHHADRSRAVLEAGDIEEGLAAAAAIGDDRLQRQSRGYVSPDSFTHGSSAQRVRWFRQGLQQGSMEACDTFNARTL